LVGLGVRDERVDELAIRRGVGRGDAHVLEGGLDVVVLLEGEADDLRPGGLAGTALLPERVPVDVLEPVARPLAVQRVELDADHQRAVVLGRHEASVPTPSAPGCDGPWRAALPAGTAL